MSVMIGIDPHKALHAVCAIDRYESELAEVVVRSGPRQMCQLLEWASPFESRTWAIESAGGLGYLLAQQLLAHGELVVDVPATLSSRARLLGSGRSNKNDANDARAVAIAALRAPSLTVVRIEDHVSVLRLLAKAQFDISHARSRACSRLHALVSELVAGGIGKEVVVSQGEQLLATIRPANAVQRQRRDLALELLDEIRTLDARLKASKRRITTAVTASGTTLTEIFGVGPIIAAIVIGYTGDTTRFPSAGHYAAYTGTAPIELSSSGRTVHRLSRRGNRTLNHAMHTIAVTQIRNPGSEGRRYYDTKLAAGRTRREAMRALKRHISDRVYRTSAPTLEADRPGRTIRERLSHPRGRQNPGTRHFGISHSRTQHEPYARPVTAATGSLQRALKADRICLLTQRGIARRPSALRFSASVASSARRECVGWNGGSR